jgi:transitional endoplasmic reticulum ATPase
MSTRRRVRASANSPTPPAESPESAESAGSTETLADLWTLRALRLLFGCRSRERVESVIDDVLVLLGLLEPPAETERSPFEPTNPARHVALLRATIGRLESAPRLATTPTIENARRLAHLVGATAAEADLIALLASVRGEPALGLALRTAAEFVGTNRPRLVETLGHVLGVAPTVVTAAAGPDALLRRAGLMKPAWDTPVLGGTGLDIEDDIADLLNELECSDAVLLGRLAPVASPGTLTLADFAHLEGDVAVISAVLSRAIAEHLTGVNVLFYGSPGTGKTELARALAAATGMTLHSVPAMDSRSARVRPRLGAYATAQQLLGRREDTLLLFDEVEDAFPYVSLPFFGTGERSTTDKAWVHDLLEHNRVPAIWITNHINHLDPALLRRFTLQVELRPLPVAVRARMAGQVADALPLTDAERGRWVTRMAADEAMTPADLARVARAAHLAGVEATGAERLDRVTQLSLGPRRTSLPRAPQSAETYDPALARTSVPLEPIVEGLRREGRGTVFLYGPPGTGKTAFAYHLARSLTRPLNHVRASDLLDPYLGVTERKMAEMFSRARDEGAVLLLDEADSFFASRQDAVRSWEVTQTNELLMQTEAADCIFVCTTNLVERIDEAAFRRFDARVKFEPADAFGLVRLVARALGELGVDPATLDPGALAPRLGTLTSVSAGDVKAARRQFALVGTPPTPEAFADALRADAALRGRTAGAGDRRIGF